MTKHPVRKKKLKRFILIALGLIIAFAAVFAFTQYDFSNPDDLSLFIERKFQKTGIAGLAVSIVDDSEITYFYSCGYADTAEKRNITEDTIFQIASISKTVTGTAVMQLYERGLLDIDADIDTYLPIEIVNPHYPDKAITARMLLSHTSSIKDNWDVYDSLYTIESGGGDSPIPLDAFIEDYFLADGQWYDPAENYYNSEPGSFYEYSNCGYALLGYLVQCVSSQPFNEYCRDNIFEPLQMENTGWFLSEVDTGMMAFPYDKNGNAYPLYGFPTYPDGCLKTSSADYARFMMAMINNGKYDDARILREDTVAEMLRAHYPDLSDVQGLTWNLKAPEELRVDCGDQFIPGHTGGDPGIITVAFFSQAEKRGLVLFINGEIRQYQLLSGLQLITRLCHEVIS